MLLPSSACCDLCALAYPWRRAGLCLCVLVFQVALMSLVPSAMAALDSHRGVAEVAQYGLGFLWKQSVAPENRVRLGVPECVTRPGDMVCSASGLVNHFAHKQHGWYVKCK
jgi:hypothetical protein